jgi:uncharacterized iron-regulated membrane protein
LSVASFNVRKLVFNAHLLIALMAGAFMVILGVTGSIMEFEPELDQLLRPSLSYVTPGQRVLPLAELGDDVSRKFDGEPVVAYLPSFLPNRPSQVVLPRGIVYVNQYTGEVLGVRARGQTFLGYVRAIHVHLGSGDFGRNILSWSAVALLLSLASGVYLWWPTKGVRIRGQWGSRRLWFDLHNAIGIFMLLPLTVLAATGTVLGFEDQFAPLLYKVTRSNPAQFLRAPSQKPRQGATPISPDEAVATARIQMPGAVPYRVQMPNYGGTYQVALLYPQDRITGDRNVVGLDPYGNVVSLIRSRDLSRGDRILAMNEAVHTGTFLGLPSRIVVWLASTMIFLQASSGLLMWLYRSKLSIGRSR